MNDLEDFVKFTVNYVLEERRPMTYYQLLRELKDWRPQNRHVTSEEEINFLDSHFLLYERSVLDLRNLRDATVSYYTALMDDETRKEDALLAMMSITAVIDQKILSLSNSKLQ